MLAISTYTVVVAIHVVVAVSLLGVAGAFSFIGPAAREDITKVPFAMDVIGKAQRMAVIPGAIGMFLTGGYLIGEGDWSVTGDGWLLASLIVFALLVAGLFVTVPAVNTAKAEAEKFLATDGPPVPTPEFIAAVGKLRKVGPASGVMTMVITFLMVAKPF